MVFTQENTLRIYEILGSQYHPFKILILLFLKYLQLQCLKLAGYIFLW